MPIETGTERTMKPEFVEGTYFYPAEWFELRFWERRLSHEFKISADDAAELETLYIAKWATRFDTTDGLGMQLCLLHSCIQRELPWVTIALALVGYKNALHNCGVEVSPEMVWADIHEVSQTMQKQYPLQTALFWKAAATHFPIKEPHRAACLSAAGDHFTQSDHIDSAFRCYRDAYEINRNCGHKLKALENYSKANAAAVKIGKVDSLATDFGIDLYADEQIVKLGRTTVFIAGTDDVRDLINQIFKELPRYGYKPLWFHKRFPLAGDDAMEECLRNASEADRFILIIDRRYGLPYKKSKISITEEEFNRAYKSQRPMLIFIRSEVWNWSRLCHRKKKQYTNLGELIEKLAIKGDPKTYEFIERIEHMQDENKTRIPWIIPFGWAEEIIGAIVDKWGIGF